MGCFVFPSKEGLKKWNSQTIENPEKLLDKQILASKDAIFGLESIYEA